MDKENDKWARGQSKVDTFNDRQSLVGDEQDRRDGRQVDRK